MKITILKHVIAGGRVLVCGTLHVLEDKLAADLEERGFVRRIPDPVPQQPQQQPQQPQPQPQAPAEPIQKLPEPPSLTVVPAASAEVVNPVPPPAPAAPVRGQGRSNRN